MATLFSVLTSMLRPPQRLNSTSIPVSYPLLKTSVSERGSIVASAGNYNVQVVVKDDEPDEEVVRKFRGAVLRAGILQECKRRRFFEDKQAEQKRRTREAAKRNKRRRSWNKRGPPAGKKEEVREDDGEEEDNWELPAGGLPY